MTRRAITVLALACVLSLGVPALASAASGGTASQAITDCNDHGQLTQQYSSKVLRQALAQMPADVREYTDCFDVIERQLFKQLSKPSTGAATGSTSSGSSFLPTWLIIVIVVLALAAITFGALALRRRRTPPGPGAPGGPGGGAGGGPGEAGPGEPGPGEPDSPDSPDSPDGPDGPDGPGAGGPPAT
jgi:Spy/CpxP family protein refolding chaperone